MTVNVTLDANFMDKKEKAWKTLLEEKDYTKTAEMASEMLQDSCAFDAIHLAALSLARLGHEEAFDWCCASLTLAKAAASWYGNCAIAYMDLKKFPEAMVFLNNGIVDHPDSVNLAFQRVLCMAQATEWQKAVDYADETIARWPEFYHTQMTRGFCLHMLGRHDEAIAAYKELLKVAKDNDYEEVVNNWSCVLVEMGRQQEALEILEQYCRQPDRVGTIYNKSFLYLGMGRWPEGWHMYRKRETAGIMEREKILPALELPWSDSLEQITGKHLFFFHEQGLGDDIMFIRYARLLRPHVAKLTIGVPPTMARLAGRLLMDADYDIVCGADLNEDKGQIAKCDYIMPMLDAPAILNQRTDNIPGYPYFLPVPDALVTKRSIAELCRPGKFRIGLCWAGSSRPDNIRANAIDKRRSMSFEQIRPLINQFYDRCDFVALQLEDHRIADETRLLQPIDNGYDVLDTAAVIAQLDLVIAIDSSMIHLSAAFGKPTWMMSRRDTCWRWGWNFEETSPWYPSLRIVQQRVAGDWTDVVRRVRDKLEATLG